MANIKKWSVIPGISSLRGKSFFMASSDGEIKHIYRDHEKLLALITNGNRRFSFFKAIQNGREKRIYVYKVIALMFVPNRKGYKFIRHKDGNTHNNAANNLEWVEKPIRYGNFKGISSEYLTGTQKD